MRKNIAFVLVVIILMMSLCGCGKTEEVVTSLPDEQVIKESVDTKEPEIEEEEEIEAVIEKSEPIEEDNDSVIDSELSEKEKETEESAEEIRPAFKEAMDSYEKFFEEYCEIMKKYQENPTDMGLLKDYTEYLGLYEETMSELENLDDSDWNAAEIQYYTEVMGRITEMLMDVAA